MLVGINGGIIGVKATCTCICNLDVPVGIHLRSDAMQFTVKLTAQQIYTILNLHVADMLWQPG